MDTERIKIEYALEVLNEIFTKDESVYDLPYTIADKIKELQKQLSLLN